MSDDRDELGELLHQKITDRLPALPTKRVIGEYVDAAISAAIKAGYRKPRQVTTVEELDAAVYAAFEEGQHLVLSDRHARPWIIWSDEDGDEQVNSWPQEEDPDTLALGDITLPATVLHRGAE